MRCFKAAKRMVKTNKDITGKQVVRKGDSVLAFSDEDKKMVWISHHEKPLKTEFACMG